MACPGRISAAVAQVTPPFVLYCSIPKVTLPVIEAPETPVIATPSWLVRRPSASVAPSTKAPNTVLNPELKYEAGTSIVESP